VLRCRPRLAGTLTFTCFSTFAMLYPLFFREMTEAPPANDALIANSKEGEFIVEIGDSVREAEVLLADAVLLTQRADCSFLLN